LLACVIQLGHDFYKSQVTTMASHKIKYIGTHYWMDITITERVKFVSVEPCV